MIGDDEPTHADGIASRPSRRDFLQSAALAGASLAPGIVLCSLPAHAALAAQPGGAMPVAEYELDVATREAQPDGRKRRISCYNGRLPGPLIRARVGQKLRVKVVNHLSTPTSVHWHGLHQPGTWQMDGVDRVSREPIPPGTSFVYEFEATPAGTHWYHSHVGVQYGNGLFGPLVIDEETPPAKYDREAILVINDWFLRPAEQILAGLVGPNRAGGKMPAMGGSPSDAPMPAMRDTSKNGMPIPGKSMPGMSMGGKGGKPDVGDVPFESVLFNGLGRFPGMAAPMPYVLLKQGETVRLRLINASSTYAFRLQIGAYALTVIASDGAPVVPVEVDNLIFSPGERYDVLVTANQSRPSLIRVATLAGDEGEAILHVDPSNKHPAVLMNWGPRSLTLEALRSPGPVQLASQAREVRLRLGGTMRPYSWNINHQEYPHAEPIAAAKDEWLRFVLDNPTGMDHPFHLHGHYFFVLGPPDRLNLVDPPRKDTVNVPAGGRLVLLWKANNPGCWFFHCHIEWHVATGMARVIDIAQ